MTKIIAVDFDGCLCEDRWPDIGEPRRVIIDELKRQQALGARLILWTCREGQMLQAAVMWCTKEGLRFDALNENLPEKLALYGECRKVYADEYWDSHNVLITGLDEDTRMIRAGEDGGMYVTAWRETELKIAEAPDWQTWKRKRWWEFWRKDERQ